MAVSLRIARDVLARTERHRYGGHRQHRADLHLPPGGGPYPVVILIHGGSWRATYGKIVRLGHSAGGQLALWAASREGALVRPKRVVAQAPVADLASAKIAHVLMGGTPEQLPERYALCSPLERLPIGVPLLLVHGAEDMTIRIEHTREYARAARAAGDEVCLVEPHPGGHRTHIDPRTPAWRAVVDWLSGARELQTAARSPSPPAGR